MYQAKMFKNVITLFIDASLYIQTIIFAPSTLILEQCSVHGKTRSDTILPPKLIIVPKAAYASV